RLPPQSGYHHAVVLSGRWPDPRGAELSRQAGADGRADRGRGGVLEDAERLSMNGPPATRRTVLTAIGGAVLALAVRPAQATPETMKSAIRQVIGEAAVKLGRIKLELPPLVENGNTGAM